MASSPDFVNFICEQLEGLGAVRSRKMFGEYGVYCDGKIVGLICDDQLFIKRTEAGAALLPGCPEAAPYQGAKPHFLIEDPENQEELVRFLRATWEELPFPKPKKPRKR